MLGVLPNLCAKGCGRGLLLCPSMCGTREVLAEDCTFTMCERQDDTRKGPRPVNRLPGQKKKAQYLSRLAKTRLDCLHALLEASRQPWVAFVVRDLRILKQAVPHVSDRQASDSQILTASWHVAKIIPNPVEGYHQTLLRHQDGCGSAGTRRVCRVSG